MITPSSSNSPTNPLMQFFMQKIPKMQQSCRLGYHFFSFEYFYLFFIIFYFFLLSNIFSLFNFHRTGADLHLRLLGKCLGRGSQQRMLLVNENYEIKPPIICTSGANRYFFVIFSYFNFFLYFWVFLAFLQTIYYLQMKTSH